MSKRWSAGIFLAKAKELSRRLRSWHVEDFLSPIRFVSQRESRGCVCLTFRQILTNVNAEPSPRPKRWQIYPHEEGKLDENGYVGEAYRNPDRDTDRPLTLWLLGDFLRHLDAAPPLAALDYLKESFGHILDLPAWTVREPQGVWERSMASYGRNPEGEPRYYMVTGRPLPTLLLDALAEAAEKLLAAAPPAWGASTKPVASRNSLVDRPVAVGEGGENSSALTPAEDWDLRELLTWLKRVTPEWPPRGVDWPLVLSNAERLFATHPEANPSAAEAPQEGQEIADYLRGFLDSESLQSVDPFSRGYAYASLLLDAFALLEAFCSASLAVGYDLDALEQPVMQLPPFHALMVLGWTVAELIRCVRDVSKADMEAVTEAVGQPVQVGAAFGHNAHQATWNLADEICHLATSVTDGQLAVWRGTDQQPGTLEYAWWKLCEALVGRFPDALEAKQTRIRLESESRAAFSRASRLQPPERCAPDRPAGTPPDTGGRDASHAITASGPVLQQERLPPKPEQYVTLDQAAALVNRSKKTLERYLRSPKSEAKRMPEPDVEGGGGEPHEWKWSTIRPWLEATFGKELPALLPSRSSRPPTEGH
jgi:hypothetical protein